MIFTLGPIDIRYFSGSNWSNLELALVTARKAGQAQRETTIRTSFKSDHLVELLGEDDPTDQYIAPGGEIYYGKTFAGVDGDTHSLSAEQVYAGQLRKQALKEAVKQTRIANAAAVSSSNGHKPEPVAA
jgi:hypothetical protein